MRLRAVRLGEAIRAQTGRAGRAPRFTADGARADAYPEFFRYRDEGCDVSPHCLTCPLVRCRYEVPGGLRALRNAERDPEIVAARLVGAGIDELAGRFGLSRRSVFRVLSRPSYARLEVPL